jgi:conjugal transfer/entry exclusion protein
MKEGKIKEESQWDKKKIFLFSILVFLAIIGAYYIKTLVMPQNLASNSLPDKSTDKNVKGISTSVNPSNTLKQDIQNQINNIKNEAQNINVIDIATSSAQVQKVINDLKVLQNYPSNSLKGVCEKVCSGL